MHYTIAQRTVRDYVCAGCWGQLTRTRIDHETDNVECTNCDAVGFVTRSYADGRKSKSGAELSEVLNVLYQCGELPKPPRKSEAKLLEELGV